MPPSLSTGHAAKHSKHLEQHLHFDITFYIYIYYLTFTYIGPDQINMATLQTRIRRQLWARQFKCVHLENSTGIVQVDSRLTVTSPHSNLDDKHFILYSLCGPSLYVTSPLVYTAHHLYPRPL